MNKLVSHSVSAESITPTALVGSIGALIVQRLDDRPPHSSHPLSSLSETLPLDWIPRDDLLQEWVCQDETLVCRMLSEDEEGVD